MYVFDIPNIDLRKHCPLDIFVSGLLNLDFHVLGQSVRSECTALLNRSRGGFQTLASARALCLTTNYLCLSILGLFQ